MLNRVLAVCQDGRSWLFSSQETKKKKGGRERGRTELCEVMGVLMSLAVVISQCMHISNHQSCVI